MSSRSVVLVLGAIVAVVAMVAVTGKDPSYARAMSAACEESSRKLRSAGSTTFGQAILIMAEARLATMSPMTPPAEHRAVHQQILATEVAMAQGARIALELEPRMGGGEHLRQYLTPLLSMEMAQRERFKSIGADACVPEMPVGP